MKSTSSYYLDHFYFPDQNHEFLNSLLSRGYTNYKSETRHPGGITCRFIPFKNEDKNIKSPYLEFLHIDPSSDEERITGLSLGAFDSLDEIFKNNEAIQKNQGYLFHKNYEWDKYPDERRVGWNFIRFDNNPPIKDLFFWITEYEKDPNAGPQPRVLFNQDNSTLRVCGCILLLSPDEVELMGELLDTKPDGNKFHMQFDEYIEFHDRNSSAFLGKDYNLPGIILECESLDTFIKVAKPEELREINGTKYAIIKNHSKGWDLYTKEKIISI